MVIFLVMPGKPSFSCLYSILAFGIGRALLGERRRGQLMSVIRDYHHSLPYLRVINIYILEKQSILFDYTQLESASLLSVLSLVTFIFCFLHMSLRSPGHSKVWAFTFC